ncbi:MAG: desulfoferrodoxin FeS4 iron-binding domain-containing protein [Cyanobacteria bacterium SIG29]|nr:desulfoferrodoxin FeS4 iron-binding domain-containing protein [Cyanobacteria bacterium SIG29]
MSEKLDLFKCNVCGKVIEIIHSGEGQLTCCSLPMEQLVEKHNDDEYNEKHVPIVTIDGEHKTIRVGSILHPMMKEHYIMFIEAISPDKKYVKRKYLTPDEEPKMDVKTCCHYDGFTARELCNLHGLWVSENNK